MHPDSINRLVQHIYLPVPVWHCADCHTRGQLVYRDAGWLVCCPSPVCPTPAPPAHRGNPNVVAAIRYWNWLQGGPR